MPAPVAQDAAPQPGRVWLLVTDGAHAWQLEQELAAEGWRVELRVTRLQHVLLHLHCELAPPDVLVCGLDFDDGDVFRLMRLLAGDPRAPALFLTAWQQHAALRSAVAMAGACGLQVAGSVERPVASGQVAQALRMFRRAAPAAAEAAGPEPSARELRSMLQWNRLQAWLQPQLRLPEHALAGVETLMRGVAEDGTLLMPARLLPALRRHGLMEAATLAMARQTCDFLVSCLEAELPLDASLDVSLHSLSDPSFCGELQQLVRRSGLEPGRITIDIAESDIAATDLPTVIESAARCRMLGFQLAIDDFGASSSSLLLLSQLPFSVLKIDRAFLSRVDADATRQLVVGSCVGLARGLGLRVVAQGVETPSQLRAVLGAGCTEAQGGLLARPMTADAMHQWLRGLDRPPVADGAPPQGAAVSRRGAREAARMLDPAGTGV